jgi:pimeloyl-ACP methyl ester carboxylesterase
MKLVTRTLGTGRRTAALVHGASMAGDVWRDFAQILIEDYDLSILLIDLRGHGQSPRGKSYQVADFAADLIETLPTGLDYLIGQSLGGVSSAWASSSLLPHRYIGLDPAFTPACLQRSRCARWVDSKRDFPTSYFQPSACRQRDLLQTPSNGSMRCGRNGTRP